MAPLNQFLSSYYNKITEPKFQPIFELPHNEIKGLICIFHGLGSDPSQYKHLVKFLSLNNFAACSFGLPGHRSSNQDEFSLTKNSINDFVELLTDTLSEIQKNQVDLFFIGVSFGASFARHFADQFKRPLVNAAPFIEPYQWSGFLILKLLHTFDYIPLLNLGSRISQTLPKVAIVSPRHMPTNGSGLGKLPANAILNAYSWAQSCHFAPKQMSKALLLFSINDKTVSNTSAKYIYPKTKQREYDTPHNILSEIDNNDKNLNKVKIDILRFFTQSQLSPRLHHRSSPIPYLEQLYVILHKIIKKIFNNIKYQINY